MTFFCGFAPHGILQPELTFLIIQEGQVSDIAEIISVFDLDTVIRDCTLLF